MSAFHSLRAQIRYVVDNADEFLTRSELFAACTRGGATATLKVFVVTLSQMRDARQLKKRKAPKGRGARVVYGPGPEPVADGNPRNARPPKVLGFMAAKREREAKALARRAA